MQRKLDLSGHARGDGVTTALLDIAIGNARRGEQVAFWCRDIVEAQRCYREAADLIYRQDDDPGFEPRNLEVRWPGETPRTSGRLRFGDGKNRDRHAGYRYTVVINDNARMPGPEPVHAHTLINGF